jgi:hypothetical protein
VRLGQRVRATPASVPGPIVGEVVEIDRLTVAVRTGSGQVVWVHGDDIRSSATR